MKFKSIITMILLACIATITAYAKSSKECADVREIKAAVTFEPFFLDTSDQLF